MNINGNDLKKLALAGILGGSLALGGAGCCSSPMASDAATVQYMDIHDCAGKNSCKGLGGCKVSGEQLEKLAMNAGTPMEMAGSAHECKGMNACKGLGGCSVDAARLAELKSKLK